MVSFTITQPDGTPLTDFKHGPRPAHRRPPDHRQGRPLDDHPPPSADRRRRADPPDRRPPDAGPLPGRGRRLPGEHADGPDELPALREDHGHRRVPPAAAAALAAAASRSTATASRCTRTRRCTRSSPRSSRSPSATRTGSRPSSRRGTGRSRTRSSSARARSTTSTRTSARRAPSAARACSARRRSRAARRRPGKLTVGVLVPVAGTWRLFLQCKVDGHILTAPFTLSSVTASACNVPVSRRRAAAWLADAAADGRRARAGSRVRVPARLPRRSRASPRAARDGPRLHGLCRSLLGLGAALALRRVRLVGRRRRSAAPPRGGVAVGVRVVAAARLRACTSSSSAGWPGCLVPVVDGAAADVPDRPAAPAPVALAAFLVARLLARVADRVASRPARAVGAAAAHRASCSGGLRSSARPPRTSRSRRRARGPRAAACGPFGDRRSLPLRARSSCRSCGRSRLRCAASSQPTKEHHAQSVSHAGCDHGRARRCARVSPSGAFAHARVSPPVSLSKSSSSTASPSRPRRRTRRRRRSCSPCRAGFSIDSFVPSPGWQREVQQTGIGRGRRDPEGDLDRRQRADRGGLALPVPRPARLERDVHVPGRSRPTPTARSSTGTGSESSDNPAPTIEAKASLGGGSIVGARRSSRSSLGAVGVDPRRASPCSPGAAGRGSWHDAPGAGRRWSRSSRWSALAAPGRGVGARVPGQDVPVGERHPQRPAPGRRPHLRRGGRAALRDHLGHRRGRHARRRPAPAAPLAGEPRHARRAAAAAPAGGLVPRLLARDLGRRASGAGRLHLRGRPEPGAGAAVRDPAHRARPATTPQLADRALGRVPDGDDRDRPASRCGSRSRGRSSGASRGEPARRLDRVRRLARCSASSRSPSTSTIVDRDRLAALGVRRRRARAALARDRVRARLRRPGALLRALLRRAVDRALGRPARARAPLDRGAALAGSARSPRPPRRSSLPGARGPRRADRAARRSSLAARLAAPRSPARSGSAGSIGLLVLWASLRPGRRVAGLAVAVPRFSNVAFVSVLVLLASGIWATVLHMPTLVVALADLVRQGDPRQGRRCSPPRCCSPRSTSSARSRASGRGGAAGARPAGRARCCAGSSPARCCSSSARSSPPRVLSSLAPPAKALASRSGSALAHVGPGKVAAGRPQERLHAQGARRSPNQAAAPNTLRARRSRRTAGRSRGADVTLHLRDARHADGEPGVPADRDRARGLLAARARRS